MHQCFLLLSSRQTFDTPCTYVSPTTLSPNLPKQPLKLISSVHNLHISPLSLQFTPSLLQTTAISTLQVLLDILVFPPTRSTTSTLGYCSLLPSQSVPNVRDYRLQLFYTCCCRRPRHAPAVSPRSCGAPCTWPWPTTPPPASSAYVSTRYSTHTSNIRPLFSYSFY